MDIVIRNGTVVDGNGGPAFVGDVAIKDGKIAAVGPSLDVVGLEEIDAAGRHVMPGWTDVHTHYDAQCMWDPLLSPSGPAGVTTVITGNCGVGCAPTRATEADREFMIGMLGAIEDIPAEVLRQGTKWDVDGEKDWESFPEYLNALEKLHFAVDIACLVPHACVRPYVLGPERADELDRPGAPVANPLTQQEKEAIAECVREAVAAGAIGFSTNRFRDHRDARGILAPGTLASADEVVMCAKACAEAGAKMFDMHSDFVGYDDIQPQKMDPELRKEHYEREWSWIHYIAKEYGLTVQWLGNASLEELDKAMANGENIFNQFLLRPQAFIMGFASRGHPFIASTTFRKIQEEVPEEAWEDRLTDPSTRDVILTEVHALLGEDTRFAKMFQGQWGNDKAWNSFYPITDSVTSGAADGSWDYEPSPEESISSIAKASGRSRLEVAYDHMTSRGCTGTIWRGSPNVPQFYDMVKERLEHPRIVPGISDAGAHLNIFQDGTTPTTILTHWARDRHNKSNGTGGLSIEHCVQKQARDTAYMYGLTDRGTLEVGKKADINIVNMEELKILDPIHVYDFPTGAPRWDQKCVGYDVTIQAGVVTFRQGESTGALPGKLVRNTPQLPAEDLPDVPMEFISYRRSVIDEEDGMSAEQQLQKSLEAESGISHQSRVSQAMEDEAAKQAKQNSKL
jgi:N-acyl-D-aspartate/D-glutamate deacylase